MRIVLDLQACQASSMNRGIGRYSMALAQAMARHATTHELRIVLNGAFPDSVASIRAAFDTLLPQSHISTIDLPRPVGEADQANRARVRAAEQLREHHLAQMRPDVVHVASLFEGLSDNSVSSVLHGSGSFDTAVTLYDLIPLMRKDSYLANPAMAKWYYRKLQSLKNAQLLLAISAYSRGQALDALQLPDAAVVNISSAADQIFRPRADGAALAALRQRYGLPRPFIMYTGGIDQRKNIEGLIEAYALLPGALRQQYQLAVVCSISEVDRLRLQRLAARAGLAAADLVLTGFVSDDDLVALYNATALFVFPSLDEGFGLPVLEAMACGAPVIGSDCSSIPEVLGRADALFDPRRPQAIGDAMARVLGDAAFQASLRQHGLQQARLFSWDASARCALGAFEQAQQRRTLAPAMSAGARRPRLAFVSPLPPARSGIADYSAQLLPELARHYEVELVLAQPELSDTWCAHNFVQRTAAWFDQHAHQYQRIVYQFGNSTFHQHMFDLLERHPGVVVLHDFFLSGVISSTEDASPYPNNYCRTLYYEHGYAALAHERSSGRTSSLLTFPCNKKVLDQAAGVIVHSAHAAALADSWHGAGYARDWHQIALPRVQPGAIDRVGARQQLGFGDDDFVLCSFGMLAATKRNSLTVDAWLASGLGDDPRCHLVFVGDNSADEVGNALARRIAAHPRIRITGFASEALYRNYLGAADAAVQLRTSSRGETSAAVLDCLAYRLPTILNAHGSAAEVPAHVCLRLDDDAGEAALAGAMARLHAEPALRVRLAQAAASFMRAEHHPARAGERYREAIETIYRDSPVLARRTLLEAVAALATDGLADGDLLQVAACVAANAARRGPRQLLVDTSAAHDANGGQAPDALLASLLAEAPAGYRVEPVRLDGQRYRYARRLALALIGRADLDLEDAVAEAGDGDVLLTGAGTALPAAWAARGVAHAVRTDPGGVTADARVPAALRAVLAARAAG